MCKVPSARDKEVWNLNFNAKCIQLLKLDAGEFKGCQLIIIPSISLSQKVQHALDVPGIWSIDLVPISSDI